MSTEHTIVSSEDWFINRDLLSGVITLYMDIPNEHTIELTDELIAAIKDLQP